MLDLSVFRTLKLAYRALAKQSRDCGIPVTKTNFASTLAEACKKAVTKDVAAGFAKGGIFPWNPEAPDYSKGPA